VVQLEMQQKAYREVLQPCGSAGDAAVGLS